MKSVVSQRKKQTARVVDIISAHQAGRNITALSYESSEFPPSLTKDGEMHHGDKADLVNIIVSDNHRYSEHPDTTCVVIDGAAMVRKNKPQNSTTIGEYIDDELMPKIINKFTYSDRVDLVFDQYNPDSIKTGTRIS